MAVAFGEKLLISKVWGRRWAASICRGGGPRYGEKGFRGDARFMVMPDRRRSLSLLSPTMVCHPASTFVQGSEGGGGGQHPNRLIKIPGREQVRRGMREKILESSGNESPKGNWLGDEEGENRREAV
ncbi:hypothetical protein GOBAR_AA29265 [Gossypium barbadense]|uniref:Uncharacterized protein n=1 Tax=Gossypium barbadense TaxID=3634 RepID=A0A2P5WK08_GOSBA|nr:hypothetical protein GOBAR_AA29265 [Gossypium barbadense]